jgi:hypothetical protein
MYRKYLFLIISLKRYIYPSCPDTMSLIACEPCSVLRCLAAFSVRFTTLSDPVRLPLYPTAFRASAFSKRTGTSRPQRVTSPSPEVTSQPAKLMSRPPEVTSPSQPLANVTSPRPREVTSPPPRRRHWLSARPMRSGGARAGPRSRGGCARYSSISCSRKFSAQVIQFIIGASVSNSNSAPGYR